MTIVSCCQRRFVVAARSASAIAITSRLLSV
jgi:hypothetical protein